MVNLSYFTMECDNGVILYLRLKKSRTPIPAAIRQAVAVKGSTGPIKANNRTFLCCVSSMFFIFTATNMI